MTAWLHFIGRQYYTLPSYAAEAHKYGPTRRVALGTLKRMGWGDKVLCAIRDGKSSLIFGSFEIEKLSGLSREAIQGLQDRGTSLDVICGSGGTVVLRGCGTYTTGAAFDVTSASTLREIAEDLIDLQKEGIDIGQVMVGASVPGTRFMELEPHVRMKSLPHSQGFRPFDHQAWQDVQDAGPQPRRGYPGHFYVGKADETAEQQTDPLPIVVGCAVLETVVDYQKKGAGDSAAAT